MAEKERKEEGLRFLLLLSLGKSLVQRKLIEKVTLSEHVIFFIQKKFI